MSLFSSVYAARMPRCAAILDGVRCPSPRRVEEVLAHSESSASLSLAELAEVLQIGATEGADSDSNVRSICCAPTLAALARALRQPRPLRLADLRLQLLRGRLPLLQLLRPAQGHGALSPVARRAGPRDRLRAGARRPRRRAGLRHRPGVRHARSGARCQPRRTRRRGPRRRRRPPLHRVPLQPAYEALADAGLRELCSGTRRWTSKPTPAGTPPARARRTSTPAWTTTTARSPPALTLPPERSSAWPTSATMR